MHTAACDPGTSWGTISASTRGPPVDAAIARPLAEGLRNPVVVTDTSAATLIAIAERLDRLPLALELAELLVEDLPLQLLPLPDLHGS